MSRKQVNVNKDQNVPKLKVCTWKKFFWMALTNIKLLCYYLLCSITFIRHFIQMPKFSQNIGTKHIWVCCKIQSYSLYYQCSLLGFWIYAKRYLYICYTTCKRQRAFINEIIQAFIQWRNMHLHTNSTIKTGPTKMKKSIPPEVLITKTVMSYLKAFKM